MGLIYAGIGSRETPSSTLAVMESLGRELASRGHLLRSGAAKGADQAFEEGCDQMGGPKEIYLPWPGFNNHSNTAKGICAYPTLNGMQLAREFHPNWEACSRDAKLFHARNSHQIFGWDMGTPADLVICWTPNASGSGGTGQALRIARHFDIPVFDLADPESFDKLDDFPGI